MSYMFWVWLSVIVVTAVLEFATMEIASIWFTLGAVVPFILAGLNAVSWEIQIVIFVLISAVLIVSLRGITRKFLLKNSNVKTNVDSLIGQKCRMLSRTDFETIGTVKIGDVVWSAIGENQLVIEANEIVEIVSVKGNKLIVKPAVEETRVVEEEKPKKSKNVRVKEENGTGKIGLKPNTVKEEKSEKTEKKPVKTTKNSEKTVKNDKKSTESPKKANKKSEK